MNTTQSLQQQQGRTRGLDLAMRPTVSKLLAIFAITVTMTGEGKAQAVPLQNATATFSQTSFGGGLAGTAIDGNFASNNGWSIYEGPTDGTGSLPNNTNPQTAVFESVSNVGGAGGTSLTFTLYHNFSVAEHTLGRFRLSATTDARSEFADGLASGGDVTANWVVLQPLSVFATNGAMLSIQGDGSILAGGPNPANSVYTVTADTPLSGMTGFRLEVLADPSLPDMGPGRRSNGNFGLTEFQVAVVPDLPRLDIRVSQVELCWQTVSNTWYQLQYRSTLTTNQWTPLTGAWITGDSTRYCTTDPVLVGTPERFYQLSVTNSPPQ